MCCGKDLHIPQRQNRNLALGPWLCTQKVVDEERLCNMEERLCNVEERLCNINRKPHIPLKAPMRLKASGAEGKPEGAPRLLCGVQQAQGGDFLGNQWGEDGVRSHLGREDAES